MKTLKDSINESKMYEANTLMDRVPALLDDPDDSMYEYMMYSAAEAFETIADDIDEAAAKHPEKLKKVFRKATPEQLQDYAAIVSLCCGWLRGVAAEAQDYAGEEDGKMMLNMCMSLPEHGDYIMDNVYNMDYDWQSISDGEDKGDMAQEVIDNWNAVCKALVGKTWDK